MRRSFLVFIFLFLNLCRLPHDIYKAKLNVLLGMPNFLFKFSLFDVNEQVFCISRMPFLQLLSLNAKNHLFRSFI